MFHKVKNLKEGAFVLGDAHYARTRRPQLLSFFEAIEKDILQPTQIILLGDIFDSLFTQVDSTLKENQKLIDLLCKISQKVDCVYFEGNHDFNLTSIFPFMDVIPIQNQPMLFQYKEKNIYFSHGDFSGDRLYKLYTWLIRNRFLLKAIALVDKVGSHFILKRLEHHLKKKEDCKEITHFRSIVKQRNLSKYQCDYFVDGHYHQNKTVEFSEFIYINLAAFACNQRYFIVKSSNDKELFEEKIFS